MTALSQLETIINDAFANSASINAQTKGEVRDAVEEALNLLDSGKVRVAEKIAGKTGPEAWQINQWLKKAVLLSFRLEDNARFMTSQDGGAQAYGFDKVPLKYANWSADQFKAANFRAVPGAVVRRSAYVAPSVILMPSFVNLGAYVDSGTMVDTWATVGSCAQIGKNVHLSGGVGIGGVLEPLQANPTIIEDNCFIGARSEVVEGVIVGEGSVLSMGVFIGASTKIVDRATGKVHMGYVPPYSVVVSGSLPGKPLPDGSPGPSLYCAVIVKTVDAQTRSKTGINDLLRDRMSGLVTRQGLRFLFRTDEGEIGAPAWWSGVAILTSILAPLTLGWLALQPFAHRKLDERAFLDPMTIVAYVYVLIFALIVMLCAVSYTNLSAKRLRARGWRTSPAGLAALLPLAALIAGAAHWLYPRIADVTPWALVAMCDFALIAVALWHMIDLGLLRGDPQR